MRKKISLQRKAHLTGHKAAIFSLAQGQDQQTLLSGAGEGWVVAWDLKNPELGKVIAKVEGNIFALHYFPQAQLILAGTMNGGVHWVDLQHPEKTLNIAHHQKGAYSILPFGDFIFTGGGDGMLTRWSVAERKSLESIQLSHQSIRSIVYSEKRNEIAVGASDHNIYFLDATSLEVKNHIKEAHSNSVFSLAYSPDGKQLLSGGRDAMLRVWDLEKENLMIQNLPAHRFTINHILWHPNGVYFFTASRDKTIKVWDAKDFELLKVIEGMRDQGHFNSVNRLHWQDDHLISASDDRSIIIWELAEVSV